MSINLLKKYLVILLVDIIFIMISITGTFFLLQINFYSFKTTYTFHFLIFVFVWILGSLIQQKYIPFKQDSSKRFSLRIIGANLIILMLISLLLFAFHHTFSRSIILGTILFTTIFELIAGNLYLLTIKVVPSIEEDTLGETIIPNYAESENIIDVEKDPELVRKITEQVGEDAKNFIFKNIVHLDLLNTLFVSTTTRFNIDNQPGAYQNIINLKRINDIPRINKFFESVNKKLPRGGIFIDCVETYHLRKERIFKKYMWGFNGLYYALDFIVKRIFPKLVITKGIYFFLTRGNNRVLSKAETFGRIYSCGFKIVDEVYTKNCLFFAAQKIKNPEYDLNPTYGPLIKLRRVGKNGKLFNVYKLRTMHPYAEYLQQYIYQNNHLDVGGKFKDDFRVTTLGKIFRKFWIDELPMFINLIKGDIKFIGVRPLSQHYFSLLSDELKTKRILVKPGLLPPYYADLPKTMDEIMASELKYLEHYAKHPFKTDCSYFWKILYNILIKKARSK